MSVGVGAGFVIDGDRIMTNAHVVSNARFIVVEKEDDPQHYPAVGNLSVMTAIWPCCASWIKAFFKIRVRLVSAEFQPSSPRSVCTGIRLAENGYQ